MKEPISRITQVSTVFLLLLLTAPAASAEIYNCDGKWTNSPCNGEAKSALPESERSPQEQEAARVASKKSLLIHDVRSLTIRLKKDHSIHTPELERLESYCRKETTSLEQCEKQAHRARRKLTYAIEKMDFHKERESAIAEARSLSKERRNAIQAGQEAREAQGSP